MTITNQYPGNCMHCGQPVAAGEGFIEFSARNPRTGRKRTLVKCRPENCKARVGADNVVYASAAVTPPEGWSFEVEDFEGVAERELGNAIDLYEFLKGLFESGKLDDMPKVVSAGEDGPTIQLVRFKMGGMEVKELRLEPPKEGDAG